MTYSFREAAHHITHLVMPDGTWLCQREKRVRVRIKFEPRDLWVGIFWDRQPRYNFITGDSGGWSYHIYICLVPMVPIHINWIS